MVTLYHLYFNDITKELNLKAWNPRCPIFTSFCDPISESLNTEHNQDQISKWGGEIFRFTEVNFRTVQKLVMSLKSIKSTT